MRRILNPSVLLFLCTSLILLCTNGCKKSIITEDGVTETELKRDFFDAPANTDPAVLRIISEIRRRNEIKEFIPDFVKHNGYAVWDKAIKSLSTKKSQGRDSNLNGATSSADTIIFIPLVFEDRNQVIGFIKAVINNEIYLNYSLKEFYKNYSFDPSSVDIKAEEFAEAIMYLDAMVYEKKSFKIIDKRLYHPNSDYSDTPNIKKIIVVEPDLSRLASICYHTNVITITANWHCTHSPIYCYPTCDECPTCVDYSVGVSTEFHCFDEEIGGDPTGGGSSDGGGRASIPPYFPCVSTPIPLLPGDPLPPCPPPSDDPGWEPTTTANPCDAYIQALKADANFASKFKELGQPGVISLTYEKGYLVQDRITNNYVSKDGSGNANGGSIPWTNLQNISGTLHSHYSSLQQMFSPQDVISLANSYIHNEGSDPANLFEGVNTASGPYLIKVIDAAKFAIFANKIAGTEAKEKKFRERYKDSFLWIGNPSSNEMEFLKMLNDYGAASGLGFYRGNSDCNQWTSLKLERHASGPDTIETTDCN